jgi:TM2 domain-containing membrane protein YozV
MSNQTVSVSMDMEGKNVVVAYLLWWLLGFLGVHRFYLGRKKSGLTMLALSAVGFALSFVFIGIPLLMAVGIWWLFDAYFTHKIVNEINAELGVTNSSLTVNKETAGSSSQTDELDQLEKLHRLKEAGVIDEDEYQERRNKIRRMGSDMTTGEAQPAPAQAG